MTLRSSMQRHALGVAVFAAWFASAPAYAFADDEARRAILDLREQVHQMAEHDRQVRLDMADQIEMLKQEVMSLRGQIEHLKLAAELEQRANQGPSANTIQVSDPQEQAAYEQPVNLFRSGKYKEAADAFNLFLESWPDSQLAPEARFYRGSSQYATKQFKESIDGLQQLVNDAPNHPRAADALLIIAASQIELDDLSGAKASLQRIVKDYPDTSAAQTAQERLKLL